MTLTSSASSDVLTPGIKAKGVELSAAWLEALVSARVDLGLGLPGRAVLRFLDRGYALSAASAFPLQAEVVVSAGSAELLRGEVTAVLLEEDAHRPPELVVTVHDRGLRLASTGTKRGFVNKTITDVLRVMSGEAGLSVGEDESPSGSHEYLLQTGSNAAFLDALCSHFGLTWSVAGHKLHVRKASASGPQVSLAVGGDGDLVSFSVRATSAGTNAVKVRGWDTDAGRVIVGDASTPESAESPFVTGAAGRSRTSTGTVALSAAVRDSAEATRLAESRLLESASAAVLARGTTTITPSIRPTTKVKVDTAGPTKGTYRVTEVEHRYDRSGFTTRFTAGPVRPSSLVDLLGRGAAEPAGLLVPGVITGTVTDTQDPVKRGRVKVKYAVEGEQVESAWARLVAPGAGKKRGMLFLPEVDDEVLIAFERGDTRTPVVLGSLFSQPNDLPHADSLTGSEVTYRRITSRLGHVVELADGSSPDKKHIRLELASGPKIRLGDDETLIDAGTKDITITNGKATLQLKANGDITLSGMKVVVEAKTDAAVSATKKLALEGKAQAELTGAITKVKASGMGAVEAGAILEVKGSMVKIN